MAGSTISRKLSCSACRAGRRRDIDSQSDSQRGIENARIARRRNDPQTPAPSSPPPPTNPSRDPGTKIRSQKKDSPPIRLMDSRALSPCEPYDKRKYFNE